MNVLLVSTNRCRDVMPPMPLGIACLAPYVHAGGHAFQMLDLMFAEDPFQALRDAMEQFRPHVVGFSIRNIENQIMLKSEFYLPQVKAFVDQVRRESGAKIIVGGAALGVLSQAIVDYLEPDGAIAGEAEEAIVLLLTAIENVVPLRGIPGLVMPRRAQPAGSRIARPTDLDRMLEPDRRCLALEAYRCDGSIPNIVTKRGCAFQCSFCETPLTEGARIRAKHPRVVAREVESLLELGFDEFFFTDPVFNVPADYADAVANEILRRGLRVKWRATLHPRYVSAEHLQLLRRAGLSMVFLGSDHGSAEVLENYAKDITPAELMRANRLLRDAQIPYFFGLLLGGPGETQSTVGEALDLAATLSAALVGIRIGIRIYPQTPLWRQAVSEGRVAETADLLLPTYYLARGADECIVDVVRARSAGQPNWVVAGLPSEEAQGG